MDIRWKQRFSNYSKALATLNEGIEKFHKEGLSSLEKQGIIQGFEFTHELSWKVMQDFLHYQGESSIYGSKDATRLAFNRGIISHGQDWMTMISDRSLTSHTYLEDISDEIFHRIIHTYHQLFIDFEHKMDELCHLD